MEINIRLLKAANLAASKEQVRYYLQGVAVQADARGSYLVATDGHRLLAFRQSAAAHENDAISIIIPSDIIAGVKLNKHIETAELSQDSDKAWRLDYCGTSIIFAPIDGTFPEWRRIVPETTNGKPAQFNPAYVGDMAKVMKALGASICGIAYNGEGPALITFGDGVDGFGVLMPMRVKADIPTGKPFWAR
jgi:DNA polymerase-3 subunit beta